MNNYLYKLSFKTFHCCTIQYIGVCGLRTGSIVLSGYIQRSRRLIEDESRLYRYFISVSWFVDTLECIVPFCILCKCNSTVLGFVGLFISLVQPCQVIGTFYAESCLL